MAKKKTEKLRDPIVKLRKVIYTGKSYYICIPKAFIKRHGIKKGEKLPVLANHIMKVIPMKES